jgi:glycosyltransferase involved in cell wall biosynthesis
MTASAGNILCLSMVVRDVADILPRCLGSVAPHIGCWVIADAGSSDGTPDIIRSFFAERGLSGELHDGSLDDAAEARNAALARARAAPISFDYLLFVDADLELVVDDPGFRAGLTAPGYRMVQRDAARLANWRTRLVHRAAAARFRGVARPQLETMGKVAPLRGAHFYDHADGADRVRRAARDIVLLTRALAEAPDDARGWYDLGQAYREAGRPADAARAFAHRAALGGGDEEAWAAHLEAAHCLRDLGDEDGFLRHASAASKARPHRAEPLYDLAKYFRVRSQYDRSIAFSEPGLVLTPPQDDHLLINDFAYAAGLREEFAIAAHYARDAERRERGHQACNWLSLHPSVPVGTRNLARFNLRFYARAAAEIMPSFVARPVGFMPPGGYRPTNPSIARLGTEIVVNQRCVNYTLDEQGVYHRQAADPSVARNFLLRLDDDLNIRSARPILPPTDLPVPRFNEAGPTDLRLFAWRDALWCLGYIEETDRGQRHINQMLARIDESGADACRLVDWCMLRPDWSPGVEKNWMPHIDGDDLLLFYSCDPTRVLDADARIVGETVPSIAAKSFRGGSQAVTFDGGWLAIIHQVAFRRSGGRLYLHRFVWFDRANMLRRVSRQFYFNIKRVEFAAGLAWHPDGKRLLVSYGVDDAESWIAEIASSDVSAILDDVSRLPSGLPSLKNADRYNAQDGERSRARQLLPKDLAQHLEWLLILAFPNGGSTALAKILATAKGTVLLQERAEGQWLVPAMSAPRLRWAPNTPLDYAAIRRRWVAAAWQNFDLSGDERPPLVIEKSPPNMCRHPAILAMLEGMKTDTIVMTRDPFATCARWHRYGREQIERNWGWPGEAPTDDEAYCRMLARIWLRRAGYLLAARPNATGWIRYEDLTDHPAIALKRLADAMPRLRSIDSAATIEIKDYPTQPLRNMNVEQTSILTPDQKGAIASELAGHAEIVNQLGYDTAPP